MTSTSDQDGRDLLEFADAVNAGYGPQPTNELERTYLKTQRGMGRHHTTMPAHQKMQTWEDIMNTVAISSPPGSRRGKRMSWSPLASAAAALLIIVASFGTWYLRDGGSNPPPDFNQHAAIAPVSGERLHLQTPASRFACDFSQDMPILSSNGDEPIGGTFLYYEPGGDLMLHCDAEPEDVVLASGVINAGPLYGVPGMVSVSIAQEGTTDEFDHSEYLNVLTGQTFVTDKPNSDYGFMQWPMDINARGRFEIIQNADGKLVALDTTTMSPLLIEDLFGENAPESFYLRASSSNDGSILAMVLLNPISGNDPWNIAMRAADIGTPGDILLLDANTGETSWLTLPDPDAAILQLNLSPDGSTLAVFLADPDNTTTPDSYVETINTANGSVIAQTGYFVPFNWQVAWTDAGLVVQADNELWLMPADGGDVETIYAFASEGTGLTGLNNTLDPNTVTVQSVDCDEECRLRESDVGVTVVNAATGESTRFMGQDVAYMSWVDTTSLMVMMDPAIPFPDPATATVIDPLTGETVTVFEGVPGIGIASPNAMPSMGMHSADVSANGQVRIVGISVQSIIELRSDGTTSSARMLPVPGRWADFPDSFGRTVLFVSPDGNTLSLSVDGDEGQARFLLDLSDPEAEWVSVSSGSGSIFFVTGVPED